MLNVLKGLFDGSWSKIAMIGGAVLAIMSVYCFGYSNGVDATVFEYEQRIKMEKEEHDKSVKEITERAERIYAEAKVRAESDLADLRRASARDGAELERLREQLSAYRNQPLPTVSECVRDRNELARLGIRGADLLGRAKNGLKFCEIELKRAGACVDCEKGIK